MVRGASWAFHETNIIRETFFCYDFRGICEKDEYKRKLLETFRTNIRWNFRESANVDFNKKQKLSPICETIVKYLHDMKC